ncbi:MAG TPA: triose-phosphate isomerase [Candidatus Magasanikbacteria bacterium]|nr:triose-phosphate isomerase [Candidatus Magasanikbacteria bacterium]
MTEKKFYFFANWKMYLDFDESNILANGLAEELKNKSRSYEMTVFPSALALQTVTQVLRDLNIDTGIQNGYWVDKGGYTGEISFSMAQNIGCRFALIGHSERRHQFKESNHDVRMKMENVINNTKLVPVLCVGETQKERDDGKTEEIIEAQLRSAYDGVNWDEKREIIIAYEPVWAIGTGNACDAKEAQSQHERIKAIVKELLPGQSLSVLYGGSVSPENAENYLKEKDIDGVLVGGASAKMDSWLKILAIAEKISKKYV